MGIIFGQLDNKKGKFEDILVHYEGDKKITSKAITYYEIVDSNFNYSLIRLTPYTGRKHQLRKQLSIRGHPIIGDDKYKIVGKLAKKTKLMLHSHKISFSIDNIKYNFVANLPNDFIQALKKKYLKTVSL